MPRDYGATNVAPWASAPAVGPAGSTYYNTVSKALSLSDGTTWTQINPPAALNFWQGWLGTPPVVQNDTNAILPWTTIATTGFSLASSGTRVTASVAGRYVVTAVLCYAVTPQALFSRCIIRHYNSVGTLLATGNFIGNSIVAGGYGEAVGEIILDMAVNDYFTVTGAVGAATGQILGSSANTICIVQPLGGTKGDIGAPGGPVPIGGTIGQLIVKQSSTDNDVAWKNPAPRIVAGSGSVSTDAFGNAGVTMPAGFTKGALLFANMVNAQRDFPHHFEYNQVDSTDTTMLFICKNFPAGTSVVSTIVGASWCIMYT